MVHDLEESGTEPEFTSVSQMRKKFHFQIASKKWYSKEWDEPYGSNKRQMEEESCILPEMHASLCIRNMMIDSKEDMNIWMCDTALD